MARSGNRTGGQTPAVRRDGFHLPVFRKRARLYVDGFNLHHAILDLNRRELLWLDLQALGRALLPPSERLAGVTWVSAHRPQRRDRMQAMLAYEEALTARDVRCLMGHFVVHGEDCQACGHQWMSATEKQSDVNLALAIAADAAADRFDTAYIVTTDGDHAATTRFLHEGFPDKRVVSVAPPGRGHNRQLLEWAQARTEIEVEMLERSALPERILTRSGFVERPAGWSMNGAPAPPPGPPPPTPDIKRGHLRLVVSN
ncbi:MAG: NYN domain-containing protein [Alphaproteobacteria bacterium]|nr:NYN domain-containing protein [Alphaproteobacteria bacterium]MBU2380169.1 NYN domain-containing protein [Alphaproteobacteria bacterium]